jgi:hypothetical protein
MKKLLESLESRRLLSTVVETASIAPGDVIGLLQDLTVPQHQNATGVTVTLDAAIHQQQNLVAQTWGSPLDLDQTYATSVRLAAPGMQQISGSKVDILNETLTSEEGQFELHQDELDEYSITQSVGDISGWNGTGQVHMPALPDGYLNATLKGSANFQVNWDVTTTLDHFNVTVTFTIADTAAPTLKPLHGQKLREFLAANVLA